MYKKGEKSLHLIFCLLKGLRGGGCQIIQSPLSEGGWKIFLPVAGVGSSGVFYTPLGRTDRFALKVKNCRFAFEVWVLTIIWPPIAVILSHNIHFSDPGRIPKAIRVLSSIFKKLYSWIFRFTLCSENNSFYLKVAIEI